MRDAVVMVEEMGTSHWLAQCSSARGHTEDGPVLVRVLPRVSLSFQGVGTWRLHNPSFTQLPGCPLLVSDEVSA